MKRKFWFLTLLGVVVLSAGLVFAAQQPPPPISSTGQIISLPATITGPGYYFLAKNLSSSGTSDGITVSSDNVTIDMMGYCLIGPGSGSNRGITVGNPKDNFNNVEIRNGSLSGWFTAVYCSGMGNRAFNLRVEKCSNGIRTTGIVKDCNVDIANAGIGIINSGVTTGNMVSNCTVGITGTGTISNNFIAICTTGIEWSLGSIIGNTILSTQTGISILDGPSLVTQNTVAETPTPLTYSGSGGAPVIVNNAGFL